MQHQPAHQLDVEMALLERPLGGFTHRGEGWWTRSSSALPALSSAPEFFRLGAQLIVAQGREFGLQRVYVGDLGR